MVHEKYALNNIKYGKIPFIYGNKNQNFPSCSKSVVIASHIFPIKLQYSAMRAIFDLSRD